MANENILNETSELYSTATYTGNGTTTNFVVPFPYLYTEDVHVYLNNVAISVYPVISTSNPPSPFEAHWYSSNIIRFTTAPAEGVKIKFQRITNRAEPEVEFRNSSILTEDDLNLIATQLLFVVQEAYDYFSLDYTGIQLAFDTALLTAQGYAGSAGSAATIASSAADVASSAATLAGGYASSISSSLAVAAGYVDNTSAVASGAIVSINGAKTSALSDISSAQSGAMTTISGGYTSAVNAINGAQITATSAVSAAQTSAVNAVTTAQGVASSAITSAQTSATSAINSAKSSALNSIASSGSATISAITSEGGVQLARLEAYGDGILQQVTGTYTTMTVKLTSPILANTIISLPKDSNNNYMTYVVGTDTLAVGWNGTDCYKNYQYEEVGNDDTISYQIKLLFDANAGDILAFKFLNTNLSALVAEPLQPDGVTININSSGKLAAVITSDAVMSAIGYTPANDSSVIHTSGGTISGGLTVTSGISGTCTNASSLGGVVASSYVTTSGAQTISGSKTFTDGLVSLDGTIAIKRSTTSDLSNLYFTENNDTATAMIRQVNDDDSTPRLQISEKATSGTQVYTGPQIWLNRAGGIILRSTNTSGTGAKDLVLDNNGTATWDGSNINTAAKPGVQLVEYTDSTSRTLGANSGTSYAITAPTIAGYTAKQIVGGRGNGTTGILVASWWQPTQVWVHNTNQTSKTFTVTVLLLYTRN